MWKLELAMAALFPALLLGGAAVGREAFDESLRLAYAMAMITMALMTARWGTPAGTAGALAFLVIILGLVAMCAGVLTLPEERTQTAIYYLTAGTSVALATAVTAAAAILPRMSRPWRAGRETAGRVPQEPEEGIGKDTGETLKSDRVRTAGELREFIRDLPQDTRILFPRAEDENKTHEGIDVEIRETPAGGGENLHHGPGRRVPPTTPEREKNRGVSVLLFG